MNADTYCIKTSEYDKGNNFRDFRSGKFFVGCNYWASHAGTAMWRDWRPDIVEGDFQRLSKNKVTTLRVFPLWSDFQPIHLLRGGSGDPVEYRFGEEPLPDDAIGQAGVSRQALDHFRQFADLAERYHLRLIVGLVTGWMSGRLFVPSALEGRNVLTDPDSLMWQGRFVKVFVQEMKDHPAIIAWDLGNECNCMARVGNPAQAWLWTHTITGAIRSSDSKLPILSGMHSLCVSGQGNWQIKDQAELTDILTTHPYPSPTYGSDRDPGNTISALLHPTANTLFYRGIGNRPCFAEEMGTFGPMNMSEACSADYIRSNLFTLWAHDCRGLLWWCANEQNHLLEAPYDWVPMERELGLFRSDYSPRPVLKEIRQFAKLMDEFPYGDLPQRIVDAICILPSVSDAWSHAYGCFVLAKQAGLDIEYQTSDQPIKESGLYLLIGTTGIFGKGISYRRMQAILNKVNNGAILYISTDGACFDSFESISGVRVDYRYMCQDIDKVVMQHAHKEIELSLHGKYKLQLTAIRANVIAWESDGNPALTCVDYGKGKIVFCRYPLELNAHSAGIRYYMPQADRYWIIYAFLKTLLQEQQLKIKGSIEKIAHQDNSMVSLTEHKINEKTRLIIIINHSPHDADATLTMEQAWQISKVIYGTKQYHTTGSCCTSINIPSCDAVVATISKN